MEIEMKYPKDSSSIFFDGKEHTIIPRTLKKLEKNGIDLYLLGYEDKTLNKSNMMTLLYKNNGEFIKIPLNNYKDSDFVKFQLE